MGLGCNQFGRRVGRDEARRIVDAAIDGGSNFIDTSNNYPGGRGASETFLGEILKGRRERVVLATKFGSPLLGDDNSVASGSRAYIRGAVRSSLRRLQTDHIDVYYHHFPDDAVPIAETLAAMQELVDDGSVRAIGLSNRTSTQLAEAIEAARADGIAIAALQNEFSLLERAAEDTTLPLCVEHGIGFVAYQPLAKGLLTGKYRRGDIPAPDSILGKYGVQIDAWIDRVHAYEEFASARGTSVLELAIAAAASRRGIAAVICGATTAEQSAANAAAGSWRLGDRELKEVWQL